MHQVTRSCSRLNFDMPSSTVGWSACNRQTGSATTLAPGYRKIPTHALSAKEQNFKVASSAGRSSIIASVSCCGTNLRQDAASESDILVSQSGLLAQKFGDVKVAYLVRAHVWRLRLSASCKRLSHVILRFHQQSLSIHSLKFAHVLFGSKSPLQNPCHPSCDRFQCR